MSIRTTLGTGAADTNPLLADIDIDDALLRIADATGTNETDIDVSGVRGFSVTERAILSIIRGMTVDASATSPFTRIHNATTPVSLLSASSLGGLTNDWVNVSDIFGTGLTTATNSYPYLLDLGATASGEAVEIDHAAFCLTHNEKNRDYDFELRFAFTDDTAGPVLVEPASSVISWVRTGNTYSQDGDGKIASTVNIKGFMPAGTTTDASRYLILLARIADGSHIANANFNPQIYLQTESSVISYRTFTA